MNNELEVARLDLEELIEEYHTTLSAAEESGKIAPDGRQAHLGRIIEAGQQKLRRYKEITGDQADTDLLQRVPATFKWNGRQP